MFERVDGGLYRVSTIGNDPVVWEPYNGETFNTFHMAQDQNITNIGAYHQRGLAFWRHYMSYIVERDFYYAKNPHGECVT